MESIIPVDYSGRIRLSPLASLNVVRKELLWTSRYVRAYIAYTDRSMAVDDFIAQLPANSVSHEFNSVLAPGDLLSTPVVQLQDATGSTFRAFDHIAIVGFKSDARVFLAPFVTDYNLETIWYDEIGNFGSFHSVTSSLSDLFASLSTDARVLYADVDVLDGDDNFVVQSDAEDGTEDIPTPQRLWNHDLLAVPDKGKPTDGHGVVIAVVDGLMAEDHPDLAGAYGVSPKSVNFADDLPIIDHGMGVASVALGRKTLGGGRPLGIAPSGLLLPIGIDTSSGASYTTRARAIYCAAQIASTGRLKRDASEDFLAPRLIVNCSWKLRSYQDLTAIALAFKALTESPAICVCSAGNENSDQPHVPSDYDGVVSVAGIDINRRKFSLSNFGGKITFCAPAGTQTPMGSDDIYAATVNAHHAYVMGTSFAAPHVSGVLAAIWSRYPDMTNKQVVEYAAANLCEPVDDSDGEYAGKLGHGLLTLRNLP